MILLLRLLSFAAGGYLVYLALISAVRTLVVPRAAPDRVSRLVFRASSLVFGRIVRTRTNYLQKDSLMAYYAPVTTLVLLAAWLALVLAGYMLMFWGSGVESWEKALRLSGSSLFTLGFEVPSNLWLTILEFSAAAIGLILVALLIAYLPTIYAAFQRRESLVTLLEVRAGDPPSAQDMILRFHRIHGLDQLAEQWRVWEIWFADIEESHTTLANLVFYRSPQPNHHWVTAAGAVLDTAAITQSSLAIPNNAQAALCIRAGYLALRHIADFFAIKYDPDPHFPESPISVTRQEYDALLEALAAEKVPLKPDREQAWRDYAGWRVNYDTVLIALARLTRAPAAPWSSDRV